MPANYPEPVRPDAPALTVAAVAKILGVAPATLRTWDRRYGLGPSAHSAGAHRRYGPDDVERLLAMRQLTLEGVAPGDAARSALESTLDDLRAIVTDPEGEPGRPTLVPPVLATDQASARQTASASQRGASVVRTLPGGRVAPKARPATALDVVEAALRHDAPACRELLTSAGIRDVVRWWEQLVAPAFVDLGSRTVLARAGEAPELVLTAAVLAAIRSRPAPAPDLVGERPIVLLLTAPGEPRPCSLHVLAAALTDRGVDARIVTGPARPRQVLELCVMIQPVAVVLVAEQRAPDLGVVRELHEADEDRPVFVHVRDALAAEQLPVGRTVHRVRSFAGLVHEVLAAAGE